MTCYKELDLPYDNTYRSYEINIDRDPDPYRDNLRWEIADDEGIWDVGTGYSLSDCLVDAKVAIDLRIDNLFSK